MRKVKVPNPAQLQEQWHRQFAQASQNEGAGADLPAVPKPPEPNIEEETQIAGPERPRRR
jgi:hypothetical protein